MAISDSFVPDITGGDINALPVRTQTLTDDGEITIASGVVFLNKAGVIAATLDNPPVGMDGAQLIITSLTAAAHTISNAAGAGFNGGGAASDVATLGAAIGNGLHLVAANGKWNVVASTGATLA